MSLNRQLVTLLSVLFGILLATILGISVYGTRAYLERQLASHAQDAATALSVTLGPALARSDRVLAETQVHSVFDRGYFQRIEVLDTRREPVLTQALPRHIEQVPMWFVEAVPIETLTAEAFIGSGWRQLGKVMVQSQPTFAYQHLWQSTLRLAVWLLVLYAGSLALAGVGVRAVLHPLRAIEATAQAVQDKRFEQIALRPSAPELLQVVDAMNQMSRKVGAMLEAETARAEALRHLAYDDELTGLLNRRGYTLWLDQLLDGSTPFQLALVLSIELDDMRQLGRVHGYATEAHILREVARSAQTAVVSFPLKVVARSNDYAFSVVVVDIQEGQAVGLARAVRQAVLTALQGIESGQDTRVHVGAAFVQPQDQRSKVLARVDLALESARQSERHGCVVLPQTHNPHADLGSHAWRRTLEGALEAGHWRQLEQAVLLLTDDKAVLHREAMLRMVDADGKLVPAAVFMPMAARHQLLPQVDRASTELVLQRLEQATGQAALAVNVSHQSLADAAFITWLLGRLQSLGADASRLSVEVAEFSVLREREAVERAMRELRSLDVKVGIDHFGVAPQALGLLRELRVDYIKLSVGLTHSGDESPVRLQNLQSIVALAHTLDVQVIAQMVDSPEQLQALREAGVDAAQGYGLAAPQ